VGAALALAAALHSATGWFSPVFTPDGRSVVVVVRESRAVVVGLGYESLTPPADVWILRDRFSLRRIDVATGKIEVLRTWAPSPLEGRHVQQYRGRLFGAPHGHLRWPDAEHMEYEVAVTLPRQPASETLVVRGTWNERAGTWNEHVLWSRGDTTMAGIEPAALSGAHEAIAVPGPELMPCGVALYDSSTQGVRMIAGAAACDAYSAAAVTASDLQSLSYRTEIERAELIRHTYAELVSKGRAAGASEIAAMLAAGREMERLGYYPRSTTLTARRLSASDLQVLREAHALEPLFEIDDMQFRVGLFQDIEAAIARPGEPVDKSMGEYIRHRDYTTSEGLNRFLSADGRVFYVQRGEDVFELSIER
jgi:hypothetical protein